MEEVTQDVQADSSTATQDVKEVVEQTEQDSSPVEQTQETVTADPQGVKAEEEVDEKGVPYKNRYMEAMRYKEKYTELESKLPDLIQEAVSKAIPSNNQQPTYTKEQLIQYKNKTDDPDARAWAELELEKIRNKEFSDALSKQMSERERQQAFEREKNDAVRVVMQKYPKMFNPDGSWNNADPLTQSLAQVYNSRESFKNDSYGLLAAADMAFANYVLQQEPKFAQKEVKLKREVKKLQKQTLLEGSGSAEKPAAKSRLQDLRERYMQSGKREDLIAYQREIVRLERGI